jgi:two-component system chemotaxis sensor kinase CheA
MAMDQFKQTYFEECDDRLLDAEEGLTAMLDGQADNDVINKVFRAIHSIKGGAGAFAFDRLVAFAHQFETVLDLVREGKLMPDWDMCQVFLRANDIVGSLIALYKADSAIPDDIGVEVLDALTKIAGGTTTKNTKPVTVAVASKTIQTWAISFRPHRDMLKSGNEPLFILRALKALGETTVTAEVDSLPPLAKLVPEQCYLGWRILLKTEATDHEIREVFDFVEDLSDVVITLQDVPPDDVPERRKTPEPIAEAPKRRKEDKEQAEVAATGTSSIRVDIQRIDQLVNLVGEMVIAQSMLQEQVRWLPPEVGGSIGEGVENLTRHMRDLQESVMAVRRSRLNRCLPVCRALFAKWRRRVAKTCA